MRKSQQAAQAVLEIIPIIMRQIRQEIQHHTDAPGDGHLPLLFVLKSEPHHLHELARKLGVSPPTMSNTITRMVKKGLISKSRSSQDGRKIVIELTEQGRQQLGGLHERAFSALAQNLSQQADPQLDAIIAGLEALRETFE
jgi:DNA-binding MarR family transcriptional regulator